jgi:hypothetical protein
MGPAGGSQGAQGIGGGLGLVHMIDDPAQLRLKAEACRRLADMAEDAQRKALWTERAHHWEQLAAKAAKRPQQRKPSEV